MTTSTLNLKLDVAKVAKAMRVIIKAHNGVMGCHIKRWPTTKFETAHDVIYISGGVSFKVPYEERKKRCKELINALEAYGLEQGFTVIGEKEDWRIWFTRQA